MRSQNDQRPIPPAKIGIDDVLSRTGLTEEGFAIAQASFGFPTSPSNRAWVPGEVDAWVARLASMLRGRRGPR